MNEGGWTIGKSEEDGVPSLCAFRQDIRIETRKRFPEQFIIEWSFSDCQPNGLPTKPELDQVTEFERSITTPLESDDEGVLAIKSTGNGWRELYFYCRDPQLLANRLNDVLNGRDVPIELHTGSDPEWSVYEGFTAPFKGVPDTTSSEPIASISRKPWWRFW